MKLMCKVLVANVVLFSSATFSQQRGENYFPISDGSTWEYVLDYYAAEMGSAKGKAITSVEGEELINGKKYYKEVTRFIGITKIEPKTSYTRVTKEGVFKIAEGEKDKPEVLHIPFPIGVGSSWKVMEKNESFEYRVEGTETLEMFHQKYEECLKISYNGKAKEGPMNGIMYYAKNVGCVRTYVRFGPVRMEILLEKYQK